MTIATLFAIVKLVPAVRAEIVSPPTSVATVELQVTPSLVPRVPSVIANIWLLAVTAVVLTTIELDTAFVGRATLPVTRNSNPKIALKNLTVYLCAQAPHCHQLGCLVARIPLRCCWIVGHNQLFSNDSKGCNRYVSCGCCCESRVWNQEQLASSRIYHANKRVRYTKRGDRNRIDRRRSTHMKNLSLWGNC